MINDNSWTLKYAINIQLLGNKNNNNNKICTFYK